MEFKDLINNIWSNCRKDFKAFILPCSHFLLILDTSKCCQKYTRYGKNIELRYQTYHFFLVIKGHQLSKPNVTQINLTQLKATLKATSLG